MNYPRVWVGASTQARFFDCTKRRNKNPPARHWGISFLRKCESQSNDFVGPADRLAVRLVGHHRLADRLGVQASEFADLVSADLVFADHPVDRPVGRLAAAHPFFR